MAISKVVYQYPYNGMKDDKRSYLSERICTSLKKLPEKSSEILIRSFEGCQLYISLKMVGLPLLKQKDLDLFLNQKPMTRIEIVQNVKREKISNYFTTEEIEYFVNCGIELNSNRLNEHELITKLTNLRGGDGVNIAAALAIIGVILILIINPWTIEAIPDSPIFNVSPSLNYTNERGASENSACQDPEEIKFMTAREVMQELMRQKNDQDF